MAGKIEVHVDHKELDEAIERINTVKDAVYPWDGKMEYDIIANSSLRELSAEVNLAIKAGWLPRGGLCSDEDCWAQAMIRHVKPQGEA